MNKEFSVLLVNVITNIFLTLLKIIVGLIFVSSLLIADGIHSLSDLLTDFFSIIGLKLANRPIDKAHPFGHGKVEYAASLTVAMIIFFVVLDLIIDLVNNWYIVSYDFKLIVLVVAVITFILKLLVSNYILRKAKILNSLTLQSSGIESRSDALSTVIVIIGIGVSYIGNYYNIGFLLYGEKIATIFIIIMLIRAAGTIYFNALVGIAGSPATKDVKKKYYEFIKVELKQVEIKELLVIKEGVNYAISLRLLFNKDDSSLLIYETCNNLKSKLLNEPDVCKACVEFEI